MDELSYVSFKKTTFIVNFAKRNGVRKHGHVDDGRCANLKLVYWHVATCHIDVNNHMGGENGTGEKYI